MPCKINKGLIPANCQDFAVGGLSGRFWVINKSDWDAATLVLGSDNEITDITPVAPASGEAFAYRFQVPPKSMATGNAMTSNNGVSGLTHSVTALIADLSMGMKNSLAALFNIKRCLIIVETQAPKLAVPAESKSPPYILYGTESGLEMSSVDTNLSDQAVGNGELAVFSTPTNSRLELNFPTNVQMTTADIEALEAVTP